MASYLPARVYVAHVKQYFFCYFAKLFFPYSFLSLVSFMTTVIISMPGCPAAP